MVFLQGKAAEGVNLGKGGLTLRSISPLLLFKSTSSKRAKSPNFLNALEKAEEKWQGDKLLYIR